MHTTRWCDTVHTILVYTKVTKVSVLRNIMIIIYQVAQECSRSTMTRLRRVPKLCLGFFRELLKEFKLSQTEAQTAG